MQELHHSLSRRRLPDVASFLGTEGKLITFKKYFITIVRI